MSEYHGYAIPHSGEALHIGALPDRKSPALYVRRGGLIRPLAYFRSEESAVEAQEFLDGLLEYLGVRLEGEE